jgi:hypothetical protein
MNTLKVRVAYILIGILQHFIKDKQKNEGLSKLRVNLKCILDM